MWEVPSPPLPSAPPVLVYVAAPSKDDTMNRPFSDDIELQPLGHVVTVGAKKPIVPLAAGSLFAVFRLQNSSCTKGYPDVAAEVVAVVPEYPPFLAPRDPPGHMSAPATSFDGHEKLGEETVCVCVRSSRSPRTVFAVSPTDMVPSSVRISLPCALLTTLHPLGHDEPRKNVANPAGVASARTMSRKKTDKLLMDLTCMFRGKPFSFTIKRCTFEKGEKVIAFSISINIRKE